MQLLDIDDLITLNQSIEKITTTRIPEDIKDVINQLFRILNKNLSFKLEINKSNIDLKIILEKLEFLIYF